MTAASGGEATSSRRSRFGADAVTVGRPYLYALGAAGERGVDHLFAQLREGLERTMALTGVRTVAEIDRSLVTRIAASPFG